MKRILLLLTSVIAASLSSCSNGSRIVILAAEEVEYNKCREVFPEIECIRTGVGAGNVTVVHATYDPLTKNGMEVDRKVKGTIHWVNAADAVKVTARLYENIVDEEKGKLNADGTLNLNPNSLTVLEECYVEPELAKAGAFDSFQFVRNGFFCADYKDSKDGQPVFNRIVSLKSSFKLN